MLALTRDEQDLLDGAAGDAVALAMRVVCRTAEIMGAERLVEISSAHVDGCLYHGDGGVEFAERLVAGEGKVRVPTTLNVGALDLLRPDRIRGDRHHHEMARRQMAAYVTLGCRPTWTCAPYQAGHRPALGDHVAWGESNAVAFANSVLGARTDRYGDFLDVCCALTGRAPLTGLHLDENRRATVLVDTGPLPAALKEADVFYPVFGSWLGATVGDDVSAIIGLPDTVSEDQLKAVGAAAASTGAVGLFHVVGVTPEAPDIETALGGMRPERTIVVSPGLLLEARDRLSTVAGDRIDAVAVGSPHFSAAEFAELDRLAAGARFRVPFYACTGRGVLEGLEGSGTAGRLREAGVELVADTCVVVTPILPAPNGVLMTNSGKFAHYTPSNTGYQVVFGSLADCVASAVAGRVVRDERLWT